MASTGDGIGFGWLTKMCRYSELGTAADILITFIILLTEY